jgi:O-antigen/teichoic acid export membrane protein
MDIFFVVVLGVCIVLMKTRETVTGTMGIGALAVGYFVATLAGLRDLDEAWKLSWTGIKSSFGESWQYSKWAVLGVAISAVHGHGIIYVISFLSGLEAVAEISAARLLLMPLGLFLTSGGRIILAKGAVLLNTRGADAFKKFILGFTLVLVSMWAGYVGLLAVFYEMLVGRMLGENYSTIRVFVVLWSIIFFFVCCRTAIALGLTVCRELKASAKYDLIASVVTLSSCFGLGTLWGLKGALASLILGEFTYCVLFTGKFVRVVRQLKSAEGEAGNERAQALSAPEEAL